MFKNELTSILRYCKKKNNINLLKKYKNDIKQTWKVLDAISEKKKCEHSNLSYFVVLNENIINHKKIAANKLFNFLVNIGQE